MQEPLNSKMFLSKRWLFFSELAEKVVPKIVSPASELAASLFSFES